MVKVPGYRIEELLSWGSQGDVFRGVDASGCTVAMKVVTADRSDGDPQAMERLRREARLLAAIDSPHVVAVREIVEGPDWSCLVLEFLAGKRLDNAVRARAGLANAEPTKTTMRLPATLPGSDERPSPAPAVLCTPEHVAWALDTALQLTEGLAAMHRQQLVHRDVKPQNAILVDERVVLIDFGFARRDGITTLTQTGAAIGTFAYMAPELLRGEGGSTRSDVHSLGATIHQCLTGSPPFGGAASTVRGMKSRGRPADVRRANPAVGASFAAVVARCLEPDPRDRYPDAGAVLADLLRVHRGERVRAPFSFGRAWRHGRRTIVLFAALAAVLLAAAWLKTRSRVDDIAADILQQFHAQPGAVPPAWSTSLGLERPAIVLALNQRLGDDGNRAMALATRLGLGLLRLQPRPGHLAALAPAASGEGAPALPRAQFVATDSPCNLLVQPGRAWFLLMSSEPQHWWAPDDPFCLQLLVQVDAVQGSRPERSIAALPTQAFTSLGGEMVRFDAGSHPICDDLGAVLRTDLATPFCVQAREVPTTILQRFRRQIAEFAGRREELDAWLRHPDEPPGVADELWHEWLAASLLSSNQPAQMSFWEAHRFATWSGCRLPSLEEWQIAACGGDRALGTPEQRIIPERLDAVDAPPGWDLTPRGIQRANSNTREWTLLVRSETPRTFLAVPSRMGISLQGKRRHLHSLLVSVGGGATPEEDHGLRLYRTLQAAAARP